MAYIDTKKGCMGSTIAWWLVVFGALNWGLMGVANLFKLSITLDLIVLLFGSWSIVVNLIHVAIGAAAVMLVVGCKCAKCKACQVDSAAPKI